MESGKRFGHCAIPPSHCMRQLLGLISCLSVIGRYKLQAEITQGQGHRVTPLGTFILLFNPWNAAGIVDICLELLNRSLPSLKNPGRDASQRNDMVYMCRVVSAMVDSHHCLRTSERPQGQGVPYKPACPLQINRGEDYSRGVSPLQWEGSMAILRQRAGGGQPVRYRQCWVFASIMCTAMRCLGVPTRVVSSFHSAHNVDGNLTIDTYYDQDREVLLTAKGDKIWNFHVWNECWMILKGLPPGYNGWWVLDPTPQQPAAVCSTRLLCCGTASVKAIKEGDIHSAYDTSFVYAEVNADEVVWLFEDGEAPDILAHNGSSIRKEISTKMVGSDQCQDVTRFYKDPEEPARGALGSAGPPSAPPKSFPGLVRRVRHAGHPQGPIELAVRFCAQALRHRGGAREPLWRQTVRLDLDFGKAPLQLPYSHYSDKLPEEKLLSVSGVAEVAETRGSLPVRRVVSLESPHLSIEVPGKAEVGKALRVHITLTNALVVTLSNCTMVLEGSGLAEGQVTEHRGTLMSGYTIRIQLDLYPSRAGPCQLQVQVSIREVKEMKG
ncbi:LOW QUALITY PROTEIN: protein-glutamine gamma-glutamyltransferase Z [Ctenodactylus gundi]